MTYWNSGHMTKRATIIGAGIIGTSCAHFLQQRGWQVELVDQDRLGGACSHANCGLISPSHVLPLAMPGAVLKSIRLMLQKNSPFYIKPRLDPRLWKWLIRFAERCNHHDMIQAGHGRHALLRSSRSLYDELFDREGWQAEFAKYGCLFVYKTEKELHGFAAENNEVSHEYGVRAELWDAKKLEAEEPALLPGLAGAWYYELDAHLRPDLLLREWRKTLESRGVSVLENRKFTKFHSDGHHVTAATTSGGDHTADVFVVATGALTPHIESQLGCEIPIQPGKGYSISMPRPDPCPKYPMLCPEHRVAITPLESLYRLGSTMEFAGYDTTLNHKRLNALKESASHYLRVPTAEPVQEEWYGWRPMTVDGLPIIDRCPTHDNVWIAAGHNMLGLSMAPATGRLLAELICDERPHINPKPYKIR